MITYSVNGNLTKNNILSKKSNKIIERMTQEETELNMAGSLNVSGTVKASKFMTADGTIIDINSTKQKIRELQESRVTPQEYKDLRDEMLKADQEFINKSDMKIVNDKLDSLKIADQDFATKDFLEEEIASVKTSIYENQDNETETSKELSAEDEIKTDKNTKKINQEVHLLNEDDKTKETEALTEESKTLDTDTAGS